MFIHIEESFMNFDYDRLRVLLTDELYNMYYNWLESLKLKDERKIMSDFTIRGIELVDKK